MKVQIPFKGWLLSVIKYPSFFIEKFIKNQIFFLISKVFKRFFGMLNVVTYCQRSGALPQTLRYSNSSIYKKSYCSLLFTKWPTLTTLMNDPFHINKGKPWQRISHDNIIHSIYCIYTSYTSLTVVHTLTTLMCLRCFMWSIVVIAIKKKFSSSKTKMSFNVMFSV